MQDRKDIVSTLYAPFDSMGVEELTRHPVFVPMLGESWKALSLEQMRALAWGLYTTGLDLGWNSVDGELLQFADGGYPYIYIVGGDSLCYKCATKALKHGEVVEYSTHEEGEDEVCSECGTRIKSFSGKHAPMFCGIDHGSPDGDRNSVSLYMGVSGHLVEIGKVAELKLSDLPANVQQVVSLWTGFVSRAVDEDPPAKVEIVRSVVNWPLIADLFAQQGDLSAEEEALVEELRQRPNEFELPYVDEPLFYFRGRQSLCPACYDHIIEGEENYSVAEEYTPLLPGQSLPDGYDQLQCTCGEVYPEIVFYVSDGEAACPECLSALLEDEKISEEESGYRPVYANGVGDDGHGLVCACGAEAVRDPDGSVRMVERCDKCGTTYSQESIDEGRCLGHDKDGNFCGTMICGIPPQYVLCKFCQRSVPENTAHLHDGGWVGDECCWDERLRSTE